MERFYKMITSLSLWIFMVMITSGDTQNTEIDLLVTTLSNSLSKAFNDLKLFMNADDLATKIKTTPKVMTNSVSLEILSQSKKSTETLVSQTSAVVDNIQAKVTEDFVKFSEIPPVVYSIDCILSNYSFYFRSKAIKNGPYELKNCSNQHMPFSNDSLLDNIKTNRQNSTVHVPTNVFDSSNEIQHVANYLQNLDETFALSEKKPQIKWQFFCSNTGFFKIFPGIKWHIQIEDMEKDNTKVDFYDCRSEQWFLESTSHPKKMMIMVDKSGSMKGRRRIIANHTIYEILNTITENDYFNLLLFTKEYLFADNRTTDILMQGTEKNKKFVMDQLDFYFVPDGIAEYDIGLNESFKVLKNEKSKENDSNIYNYLLMIITDGSPMNYQEIITAQNEKVQARIFTYLIGQASSEREVVKQMACKNKGYAVEIATLADVKENVQKYLNVVARPNAIMQNAFFIWTGINQFQMRPSQDLITPTITFTTQFPLGQTTPAYFTNATLKTENIMYTTTASVNVTVPRPPMSSKIEIVKHSPIKMFVTVSKAAYDTTNATAQKNIGSLLGAAGVDVPISDFLKTAPFWKIGANAYLFGVTHNGFVIFHPRFRPQNKKFIKYFYRNIDISELEVSVDEVIKEINPNQIVPSKFRDEILMTEHKQPPRSIENRSTYDIIDDYKTAFKVDRDYFITGIAETPYKFGFAVPLNHVVPEYQNLQDYNNMDLSVFSADFKKNASYCNTFSVFTNQGGLALKPYEFCNLNKQIAALMLQNPLCALREILVNEKLRSICLTMPDDKNTFDQVFDQYIKSLYNEADDTKHLPSEWSNKMSMAYSVGVQQIFSMHHFGLIRYFNYKNLSYEQFINDHNTAIDDPLYQETVLTSKALQKKDVLVVRPLPNDVVKKNTNEDLLIFTVSVPIATGSEYKGVVGVQVDHQFYLKTLMTSSCTNGKCLSCNNNSLLDCYVVTGSGMVVLNNINVGNTGELLKEIDCKLMESLVDNGIFKSQLLYDFQALCPNISKSESFANILTDPITKILRISIWLIYEIMTIVQNLSFTTLLSSFTFQEKADQVNELYKTPLDIDDMKLPVFSTESSFKPLMNVMQNSKGSDDITSSAPKSKRQHENFVKNTFEEKITYCKKNSQLGDSEFSGCIQKAVSDICKLDKGHNNKQSDQHVEKLTSLNTISHCVTVCLILQSDFPTIWQEQDDCKQPNYMCRTITPTFTSVYPDSILTKANTANELDNQPDQIAQPEDRPSYFLYHQNIVSNEDKAPSQPTQSMPSLIIKNGSICGESCPAKTWYARGIANTNLILIVVYKQNAACTCECRSDFASKIEIFRNISNPIENPPVQAPYYFSKFVNFSKAENSSDCSDDASTFTKPLQWMIIFHVWSILVIRFWIML